MNSNLDEHRVEAKHIYALLTDRYVISRNVRVEWFLDNLNRHFPPLSSNRSLTDFQNDIDIISFLVKKPKDKDDENGDHIEISPDNYSKFFIGCDTKFSFLSRKYCFVFVLDMSTSVANVDIQNATILTDELYDSMSKCIQNIVKPFFVPGSDFLFQPEIYITIVAYLPFYSLDLNNVIVHGYRLMMENVQQLMEKVKTKIYYYIDILHRNIKSEQFHDNFAYCVPEKSIVSSNLSLINMIRFGLLSLNLLPENSHQGIVIVTDGNTSFTDAQTLESALAQLRLSMISCSFIHIGSSPHPNSALGYVPYIDFMNFIAQATFGAYISISSDYDCDFPPNDFNVFHQAFFIYSFNYGSSCFSKCLRKDNSNIWQIENPYFYSNKDDEMIRVEKKDQQFLRRKQLEIQFNAGFVQILSFRLREGFTVKRVNLMQSENIIDIQLSLPWRHNVNIEYHISAYFQPIGIVSDNDEFNFTSCEVIVESNYNFLHDASCSKKVFKSQLRATTIKQFCAALKHFNDSDSQGINFNYFAKNEMYRSIPESIKNGVSLFYLPPNSNVPVVSVPNEAHLKFAHYWRPICVLDVNMRQKSSLYTHQINVLLKHDFPLPEYLYQPNSLGRYETIQCKQSMSVLNVVLKEWSSFVLLENHSYIKLIKEKEHKSGSFYLIRIIAQPPCLVLHLAFIGGTSGSLRSQIVNELSQKLRRCKFPQRNLSSSLKQKSAVGDHQLNMDNSSDNELYSNDDDASNNEISDNLPDNDEMSCEEENLAPEIDMDTDNKNNDNSLTYNKTTSGFISLSSQKRNNSNYSGSVNCFVILNRPIERLLIRYEKIPKDFYNCYKYEDYWRSKNCPTSYASLNMFQTLSRFLYHQRFIWCTHNNDSNKAVTKCSNLNMSSISKILSTLTLKRIQEQFTLAYNEAGVVNLVKEFLMKDETNNECTFPCLVQYIIFPSSIVLKDNFNDKNLNDHYYDDNYNNNSNISISNSNINPSIKGNNNDDRQHNGKHLIVTECWIEPQNGKATSPRESNADYPLQALTFDQISSSFYQSDFELISILLTYEYLVAYNSKNQTLPELVNHENDSKQWNRNNEQFTNERFRHIPFKFNLLSILDKSQQALIKFSTLYQFFDFNNDLGTDCSHSRTQSWNNCSNIMLYSEFLRKISQLHDEIQFTHSETISFMKKTNERLSRHYADDLEPLFSHLDLLEQDETIVFRCFCRKISNDCIILMLLPGSYKMVRKLVFVDYETQKINGKLVGQLENRGENIWYGSLVIPIIVHKLTFNSLKNILLNNYNPIEQLCPNWDLLFDYSINNNVEQPFYSIDHESTGPTIENCSLQTEEIALENFTKSIETLFRNSFTDAIYKSFCYGFEADERDIRLVLEKICYKIIDYVDITDFLIYTCEHMKPTINSYFKLNPTNSIFDLLAFIGSNDSFNDSSDNNNGVDNQENVCNELLSQQESSMTNNCDILSLKFSSLNNNNCCNNNETLKSNFADLIQSHFSSIPTPLNSYYFYDYENIQTKKFTFGEKDAKKKKENLIDFYEKIENNEINLSEFYEDIRHSTKVLEQDNTKNGSVEEMTNENESVNESMVRMADFQSLIFTKPFFVGFFYSLTLKNGTQVRKIASIPTCILDLISLNNGESLELKNFRVFLNIEIITQNVEPSKVSINNSNISGLEPPVIISDNENISLDKLLDEFQVYKYIEFFHRIKWMIRDEIVSISHNLFQVCSHTLEMVVEHIKHTGKSNSSFIDKVELKFVFQTNGDHNFFTDFQKELTKLKFSKFRLCKLGKYLYVIHDTYSEPCNLDDDKKIIPGDNMTIGERSFHGLSNLPSKESLINELEETQKNLSPNFWLILELETVEANINFVSLYFHSRQNIYLYGLEILNHLKKNLELLCKKYNQKFLLAGLYDSLSCDDLLISKEDHDPFIKNTVRSTLNSTPNSNFEAGLGLDLDYDSFDNISLKIIRANFLPGLFQCDVVWDKHFPLHRRLNSYSSKEGINKIRSMLSSFIVTNRNNLYVYKEPSGPVFYIRIYEIECTVDSFSANFQSFNAATVSHHLDWDLTSYHYDNIISPTINVNDNESKCDSDNDSVNSLNVNNKSANIQQQCILMNVHGIDEPGEDIKIEMVAAMQRKLDEALLDILIVMLARNPLSKLSYQDVSFIQGRNSNLKNFLFVINECYYPYIVNIKGYIRQNLLTFLYNPKYVDRNVDFHFKFFGNGEFHCVKDDDVFLYLCRQESGKDTKGIACIIFSILSREKFLEGTSSTFNVNQTDINDFISGYFDYIVTVYNPPNQENLNAKFYINFQIWYAGKIDLDYIGQKLRTVICHSLWEFNLEFKIIKLCTCEDFYCNIDSLSEPSTPKKFSEKRERRSGLSGIGKLSPMINLDDKITKKSEIGTGSLTTIIENAGMENYFDFFSNSSQHCSPQKELPNSLSGRLMNVQEIPNKEIFLAHFTKIAIKPWLDYGKQISVPSISRFEFSIIMKKSISIIIKEFKEYISKFSSDMKMHFLMSTGQQCLKMNYDSEQAGDEHCYDMILLRHEALWETKYLHHSENSFVQHFIFKCDVNKFEFPPCFQNHNCSSINDSNLTLNNSNDIKMVEAETTECLSPRQKFLLLFIEDQKMTLYLYNWDNNTNSNIVKWFSQMILWQNARSLLLQSLILQKAGIFHNTPFKRYTLENLISISNIPFKNRKLDNLQIFLNIDFLLKYQNPMKVYNENEQLSTGNRIQDFLFETKNYDYIFSDFDYSKKNRDLFDCFSGQFNSSYNIYIKDLKELTKVWQLHGTKLNYPTMDKIIQHVKSYGRLSHYCLTPFLFCHKWRLIVSMVRDHTLPISNYRVRHMSGGNILKQSNTEHEFIVGKQRSRRKSGPPNMFENNITVRSNFDESLDMAVCPHYIQEYVQYLQSLGFSSIKSQKFAGLKKNFDLEKRYDYHQSNFNKYKLSGSANLTGARKTNQNLNKNEYEKFYLIKTVIGGFYLFEIGFSEPFVYSYLYSMDQKRFLSWSRNNFNSSTINFLDELDSIKVRMHLHSFTYDYHLRAIHSYISGRQLFQRGYHLISFLDDFIKYYQKAPNYARNHVYSDNLVFESQQITADQLYNYIINHNQNYGIDVFSMNSTFSIDHTSGTNEEYVLLNLSSHRIPYTDENNLKKEDNFDIVLLVAYQKLNNNARILKLKQLCLKFYLLLTSQRELFPKLYSFRGKGLFRTIRMLSTNLLPQSTQLQDENGTKFDSNTKSVLIRNPCEDSQGSIDRYIGICDEKINYLGYFNAHEIVMLKILEEKVTEAKQYLEKIIKAAEIDCRRDYLWKCLTETNDMQISMNDFNELLLLVKSIRLDEYDENLIQFNTFNFSWYRGLAQKLELKLDFICRKFSKNGSLKMALFKSTCRDCFILFHLKNGTPCSVEFRIVFNNPQSKKIDKAYLKSCNPQYHELMEDFVNACTSYMWSSMVSL